MSAKSPCAARFLDLADGERSVIRRDQRGAIGHLADDIRQDEGGGGLDLDLVLADAAREPHGLMDERQEERRKGEIAPLAIRGDGENQDAARAEGAAKQEGILRGGADERPWNRGSACRRRDGAGRWRRG